MISAQTLRVCREGKPVPTFPDHALAEAMKARGVPHPVFGILLSPMVGACATVRSALPARTDIVSPAYQVRKVPILLQKSENLTKPKNLAKVDF
jgi:hypothetical protein